MENDAAKEQLPPPSPSEGPSSAEGAADPVEGRALWPILLVVGILAVVLIAGGVVFALSKGGGSKHAVTGTFTLQDARSIGKEGTPCSGTGGYGDITSGANVVISDESGKVLANGSLGSGSAVDAYPNFEQNRNSTTGTFLTYCEFPLLIPQDVPKAEFYKVEVSHRGDLTYSYEEMEQQGWTLNLSVG